MADKSVDINAASTWNEYFAENGEWEKNCGNDQTRIFAEFFCKHTAIPKQDIVSILDFGCALGDSMPVIHNAFPNTKLYGTDVSTEAIARCMNKYGHLATFFLPDALEQPKSYDIIFASNVLEHFTDFAEHARSLLLKAGYLSIMVPYLETKDGLPLNENSGGHHVRTFDRHSFDFLTDGGHATMINQQIFACPGAWAWPENKRKKRRFLNRIRPLIGLKKKSEPLQLLIEFRKG